MKIQKCIRIVPIMLVLVLLLSLPLSAALPPAAEIQWENTGVVSCDIIITGNLGTVSASITGKTGTTVQAWAILYKIVNGISTTIYEHETPENNAFPIARFTYEFEVESGVTYYLIMNGVVSKNGVDEEICEADYVTIP